MTTRWHRLAPGSYEARLGNLTLRAFRQCDCGRCDGWAAAVVAADGFDIVRMESLPSMADAKATAESAAKEA